MNSRGDISISNQGKSDESNTNISATFSCEIFHVKYAMGNLTPEKN